MVRETLEGPNQLSAVDGTPMPTLDAFACTELTSEILEKQLGVALQFLGNWLTGTDHFVSDGEVSSMASAERVRMAAHAWDRQPDAENQPSAKKLLSNEVARLRQDLGDDGFRGKGLGQARTILRRAIAAEDASEALGSRAYAQLERLLT